MKEIVKRNSKRKIKEVKSLIFKRYFYSNIENRGVITLIKGPRGVGKTTSVLQYLAEKQAEGKLVLYISADDINIGIDSLFDVAEIFYDQGGDILAIDEIHKKENWAKEIKNIYDSFNNLQLIISGSSSIEITKGEADLGRRAIPLSVKGLNFQEYLSLKFGLTLPDFNIEIICKSHNQVASNIIEITRQIKLDILSEFKLYLRQGYFPTFTKINDQEVLFQTIVQTLNVMIESDIISSHPELTGRSIEKIKQVMAILANSCPYSVELIKLSKAIDIKDQKVIKNYIYNLDRVGAINAIYKQGSNISRLIKPEKLYLENPNYAYALLGEPNIGTVREIFVANALKNITDIFIPKKGDFITSKGILFEVGGKNKSFKQIAKINDSYLIVDDILYGEGNKIPLWLLGFLRRKL